MQHRKAGHVKRPNNYVQQRFTTANSLTNQTCYFGETIQHAQGTRKSNSNRTPHDVDSLGLRVAMLLLQPVHHRSFKSDDSG